MRNTKQRRRPCVNEDQHTPSPEGLEQYLAWAEEMKREHVQTPGVGCGLWLVWVLFDEGPCNA